MARVQVLEYLFLQVQERWAHCDTEGVLRESELLFFHSISRLLLVTYFLKIGACIKDWSSEIFSMSRAFRSCEIQKSKIVIEFIEIIKIVIEKIKIVINCQNCDKSLCSDVAREYGSLNCWV